GQAALRHEQSAHRLRYSNNKRSIKTDFSGVQERSRRRSVSRVREGSLLKRGRLRQTAGEGYTYWRKFERCSGLDDDAW
ncbi:unnamed protein product, partial [Ascophyllum nodosum]